MVTTDIKDKQLFSDDNFTVETENQNPATNFSSFAGSKSLGLRYPQNDNNRMVLDNPDRFEKVGSIDDRRFPGTVIRHFGQIIHKGTLIIDEATNKMYSGWLRDVIGNLAERVAGKYINQSSLGGEKTFGNKVDYDPLSDDYACPLVFNRHFWRDRGKRIVISRPATDLEGNPFNQDDEVGQLTWQFFENEQFFVNFPTGTGVQTGGQDNAPVVSPMLFVHRLIELILSDNYIFVRENFLKDDPELRKLILYNNFNICKQTPIIENRIVFTPHYHEHIESELPVQVIVGSSWSVSTFRYSDLIPNLSLGKTILGMQNLANVVFSFNDLNECRIFDRNRLLTDPAFDVDEYMVGDWEMKTRKDVTVKLNMKHDEQDYAFSDNWQDLSDLRHNIKESVTTRPDLDLLSPKLDEIRKVTSENAYYQYHWHVPVSLGPDNHEDEEDVLGWEKITIGFQPYFFNDGDKEKEEIETSFSTIQQSLNGYPLVMQKGNSEAFRSQHEAFTPRLLFYQGNQVAGYQTSGLSLDWDGETGLVAKRWRTWLEFWANRLPAIGKFKFPASIYYYIKNNKEVLPLRTRHGSFIIDKMKDVASRHDTIEVTMYAFKRERVLGHDTGSVPGGELPDEQDRFSPTYMAVSEHGKPYLIEIGKAPKSPPAWGPVSESDLSRTTCVDYHPASKFLFVGSTNGRMWIYDLSNPEAPKGKPIQVFNGKISAVRVLVPAAGPVGGSPIILIAKDGTREIYQQPWHSDLNSYANNESTLFGVLDSKESPIRDFVLADDYYYACTQAGEVWRRWTGGGSWTEIFDRRASFTHMAVTEDYLWVFDNSDRNFRAQRSNPVSWSEFDILYSADTSVSEAVAMDNNKIILTTSKRFENKRSYILFKDLSLNSYTPGLASGGECGGVCSIGALPVVAIREGGTGATKLGSWSAAQNKWLYINVPAFFPKLFFYYEGQYYGSQYWGQNDYVVGGFIVNWDEHAGQYYGSQSWTPDDYVSGGFVVYWDE